MVDVVPYADVYNALELVKNRHLLLGNGFSISLRPNIFSYTSLFAHSELSDRPDIQQVFAALETEDFELVIRFLVDAARLLKAYAPSEKALISSLIADAAYLKNVLVAAIAKRHPDRPHDISEQQYIAVREFLEPFAHIYTLNYDVILYWALMQDEIDDIALRPGDGFRHPEDAPDEPYVSWQEAHKSTVHYVHGALHLFDTGNELVKYTWSKTNIPIIEQIRDALTEDKYPLFVAEGTSSSKMNKIMHNAYLHKCLRSLDSCAKPANAAFVVFGHSLADNDWHVLRILARGKFPHLYVSLYGDQDSPENQALIENAQKLAIQRAAKHPYHPLHITFFDAASAHVWG